VELTYLVVLVAVAAAARFLWRSWDRSVVKDVHEDPRVWRRAREQRALRLRRARRYYTERFAARVAHRRIRARLGTLVLDRREAEAWHAEDWLLDHLLPIGRSEQIVAAWEMENGTRIDEPIPLPERWEEIPDLVPFAPIREALAELCGPDVDVEVTRQRTPWERITRANAGLPLFHPDELLYG